MKQNHTIKALPAQDRPYEKCLEFGPEHLTDAELLAVILRTGRRGSSSLELSYEILQLADIRRQVWTVCTISPYRS